MALFLFVITLNNNIQIFSGITPQTLSILFFFFLLVVTVISAGFACFSINLHEILLQSSYINMYNSHKHRY